MGHISPLLGIILSMKNEYDFIYFGLEQSMEEEICKRYNISFYPMKLLPFYRKNWIKNIKTIYYIIKEKNKIKHKFNNYDIKVVISSGGYVSIPLLLGIKRSKKILLESNTTLGLSNKLLSLFADKIGVQFDTIKQKKSVLVGNPILIEKSDFDHPWFYKKEELILFVGGSNGAKEIVTLAYKFNLKYPNIKLFVITGERYYDLYDFNQNVVKYKKIFRLSSILNKFSLVISRAGASTITELLLSNSKFVLCPSKNVTGNHQYKNAKYLTDLGLCVMISDESSDENVNYIYNYLSKNTLKTSSSMIVIKDSIERIKKLII